VSKQTDVPVESATEPAETTLPDVANAQRQLKALQWAVPAITGALIVVTAYAGEQQRPAGVKGGVLQRLNPLSYAQRMRERDGGTGAKQFTTAQLMSRIAQQASSR